ncbi:MAG: hypothetical protein AAB705_01405 [Patescibacteria group bacterium]
MKKIVPVLVILALFGVGGYFYMNSKGTLPKAPIGTATNSTNSNVFTSIKDALSKSMSLKCVYKDEQGVQTTTYIKGGAVKVSMEGVTEKDQPNNIVLKDKKMYMWNEVNKTGFTFTMTDPIVTPGQELEVKKSQDAEVLAEIEKYKDSCKATVIADSFFTIPTDVKFQDMNAFTENLMKQVPTIEQITPEAGDEQ